MTDSTISRRSFLLKTVAATAAFAFMPHARILGANDEVRLAVIGVGWKGSDHCKQFQKLPGVRVVAICDVDTARMDEVLEKHFKEAAQPPRKYTDLREVLDQKDIDAVVVATPNHWHVLAAIWACQAGKDVFVEKPMSHTVWEGQQLVAAAKKYNRIIQVGTQGRSDPGLQAVRDHVSAGGLGEIQYVRGIYYNKREPIGNVTSPQTPPSTVDYKLWQGPRNDAPLMRQKFHYDWHWQWAYGNGEQGNNMVHMLDIAQLVMGLDALPRRVVSMGNRFLFEDNGETPNVQSCFYDFEKVPVITEVRNLPAGTKTTEMDHIRGLRTGVEVRGSEGYYLGYNAGGWSYDNNNKRVKQFKGDGGGGHFQNFIDAIRSRKKESLAATVENGHFSATLAHLGNISQRLAEPATGSELRAAMDKLPLGEALAYDFNDLLLRNNVDVVRWPRRLGPWLDVDGKAEKFTGERADEANALLKGTDYREGFTVPQLA